MQRLFLIAVVALPAMAFAHGDVHDRISALTGQIAKAPTNAALYFERAELHRVHQEWTNSLADYDRVQKLDPKNTRVLFCRGRTLLEADDAKGALAPLNQYLAGVTNDAGALSTRGRVLVRLGQPRPAAADFGRAIAITPTGNPELYIERAQALAAAGARAEAVRGLDEGIRLMGPLVTLELPAMDLDVALKRFDSALARVDAVMTRLARKESWLMRRAEILKVAGRGKEAEKSYRDALAALELLPPAHRYTRATLQLEASIRSALRLEPAQDGK